MRFTYLLIDAFTLIVPLLFSFHPNVNFFKYWGSFFSAAIFSAALFVPFDIYFTHLGVWGFNRAYVSGVYLGNLPVEEVLFFFCIPYSCVFTYHCISAILKKRFPVRATNVISLVLIGCCIMLAIMFSTHYYTVFAYGLLAVLLLLAQFIFKVKWLAKFYITYAVLLVPFLIVNGLLTGTGLQQPIVWYNNSQTLNLRILTIPVEDVFYGMALILLNVLVFKGLNRKFYYRNKSIRTAIKYPITVTK